MSFVPISKNAPSRVGLNQYARNGLSPVADFQNIIAERVGYAVSVRAKQVYRSPGQIYSAGASVVPASSASERTRWRFAAHAAPYAQYLFCRFWQARQSSGTAADCYARLRITDSTGAFLAEASPHFGSGTSAIDTPAYFGSSMWGLVDANGDLVAIPPDAAYFGTFTDFNYGRLVAACVWEVAFVPNTDEGYPDVSAGSGSPIYDKDRADAATMANAEWAYKAQPLWHWSVDTDAGVRSQTLGDLSGSLTQSIGSFSLSATGTVGTSAPTFVDATALLSANGTSLAVDWPSHAENDIGLLLVGSRDAGVSLSSTEGFAYITGTGHHFGSGLYQTIYAYWCRAGSGAMTAPTIAAASSNGHLIAAMLTFRGCVSSGNPYDAIGSIVGSVTNTSLTATSVTTTLANTLVVVAGVFGESGNSTDSWGAGNLASLDERVDDTVAWIGEVSHYLGLAAATGAKLTAGAVSFTPATLATTAFSQGVTIALKP